MNHAETMTQSLRPQQRRTLLDKTILYLFSFDVEVNMDRETIGFVPGGVRINIEARRQLSRVYHVMGDRTVAGLGVQTISGMLDWGGDALYWREDDVELSQVKLTIRTDDGATIDGSYPVVTYLGPGGFRRFASGTGKIGTEKVPVDVPVTTTPRFVTSSPTYRWLNDLQCLGFGRVTVVKSEFRRISYDIYALT